MIRKSGQLQSEITEKEIIINRSGLKTVSVFGFYTITPVKTEF